jgi:hypothetical protein
MNEQKKTLKREERETRARAIDTFFRNVGSGVGLGFICAVFGFACGFYAGGLAALLWPAGVVLSLWFAAGAVSYFLLRDVIFRILRRLVNPVISGSDYTSFKS